MVSAAGMAQRRLGFHADLENEVGSRPCLFEMGLSAKTVLTPMARKA